MSNDWWVKCKINKKKTIDLILTKNCLKILNQKLKISYNYQTYKMHLPDRVPLLPGHCFDDPYVKNFMLFLKVLEDKPLQDLAI